MNRMRKCDFTFSYIIVTMSCQNNSWEQLLPEMCLIQLTGASIDVTLFIYAFNHILTNFGQGKDRSIFATGLHAELK